MDKTPISTPPPLGLAGLALPLAGLVLLGAHMLRTGNAWLLACVCVVLVLGLGRQAWGRLVVAAVLLAASLFWVHTGIGLVQVRMGLGQDWMRLAAILGGVSLFSLAGSLLLLGKRAQARYARQAAHAVPQALAFGLTAVLLWICRMKTGALTILLADRFMPGSGLLEIVLVAVYAAVLCGRLLDRRTARTARAQAWFLFSAVFFGQLILGLAGVERMLMTGDLHLPVPALIIAGPLYRGAGFFMLMLFAVSVLLVGPAWCSHLCYIGAWDDRLSRRHRGAPESVPAWGARLRWLIASGVLLAALGLRLAGVPVWVAAWGAALFGLLGVGIMLFASSRTGTMVHCSTFCPLGLAGNVLGRLAPWRLRINARCTGCGACVRVCRYNALRAEDLERRRPGLSCSLCRDCTMVCAHGAMELTCGGQSGRGVERSFVVLVAVLHAVFLAVARM